MVPLTLMAGPAGLACYILFKSIWLKTVGPREQSNGEPHLTYWFQNILLSTPLLLDIFSVCACLLAGLLRAPGCHIYVDLCKCISFSREFQISVDPECDT